MQMGAAFVAVVTQHAPRAGCGQVVLVQTVPLPRYRPSRIAHSASVTTMQPTEPGLEIKRTQQAPRGAVCGQVVAVQTVFAPRQTPFIAAQSASVLIWHGANAVLPGLMQHAPTGGGGGQAVVEQATFTPRKRPPC